MNKFFKVEEVESHLQSGDECSVILAWLTRPTSASDADELDGEILSHISPKTRAVLIHVDERAQVTSYGFMAFLQDLQVRCKECSTQLIIECHRANNLFSQLKITHLMEVLTVSPFPSDPLASH